MTTHNVGEDSQEVDDENLLNINHFVHTYITKWQDCIYALWKFITNWNLITFI